MSTSIVPQLARRFLLSKVSDSFLSLIAWVSVVGVALGVLALVVVTSVINGFEGELTRVITGMNGDVLLYSRDEKGIPDRDGVEARIRQIAPETEFVTASYLTQLMAAGSVSAAGAVLDGFESETMRNVIALPDRVEKGALPENTGEVALGSALAEKIGAEVGEEVRLILPDAENSAPKAIKAKVTGIVRMGMYEYDSRFIFAPLKSVQEYLTQPGRVSAFKIRLKEGTDSRKVSDRLAEQFGFPYRAKDWSQLNQNLFYAIKLEKAVIAIILTVIVIVAAFNVVSTLMMMIHDKTKEIAILKAMGFRSGQGFQLFCLIGVGMGVVGTVVGTALGLGLSWLLGKTHWIDLPADIYYIGFLPVVVRWSEVAYIALVAVTISFLATIYPAWKVSKHPPLEGLRYE